MRPAAHRTLMRPAAPRRACHRRGSMGGQAQATAALPVPRERAREDRPRPTRGEHRQQRTGRRAARTSQGGEHQCPSHRSPSGPVRRTWVRQHCKATVDLQAKSCRDGAETCLPCRASPGGRGIGRHPARHRRERRRCSPQAPRTSPPASRLGCDPRSPSRPSRAAHRSWC
jgi:hypothetical protein